jgi:hypothetical protein
MKRSIVLMALLLALASCATAPSPTPGTTSSPMPGRDPVPVPSPSTPGSERAAVPSPVPGTRTPSRAAATPTIVDSLPSREALAVLNTIPEPLAPGERLAAPSRAALAADTTRAAAADSAAADSSAVPAVAPGDSVQVPTPAPTRPLGDRPGSLTRGPDSLATGSGGTPPPAGPTPPATPGGPTARPAPLPPDSCWRIQVAAPPEADKARGLREAAQSQLLVAMVIETEAGLHKVRTRDCLGAAAADLLRRRAQAAGFAGAFRFKGGPK